MEVDFLVADKVEDKEEIREGNESHLLFHSKGIDVFSFEVRAIVEKNVEENVKDVNKAFEGLTAKAVKVII